MHFLLLLYQLQLRSSGKKPWRLGTPDLVHLFQASCPEANSRTEIPNTSDLFRKLIKENRQEMKEGVKGGGKPERTRVRQSPRHSSFSHILEGDSRAIGIPGMHPSSRLVGAGFSSSLGSDHGLIHAACVCQVTLVVSNSLQPYGP